MSMTVFNERHAVARAEPLDSGDDSCSERSPKQKKRSGVSKAASRRHSSRVDGPPAHDVKIMTSASYTEDDIISMNVGGRSMITSR